MNSIFVGTLIGLALTPNLCQAQPSKEQNALDSFRSLVRHHADSYKPNGREYVGKSEDGWMKGVFILDLASVKFDVEKTSSLVSPFIGILTFTLAYSFSRVHSTEAEAAADMVLRKAFTTIHKHSFAYQEDKWEAKVREYHTVASVSRGDFPCDELLLSGSTQWEKDVHGCLEEFDGGK